MKQSIASAPAEVWNRKNQPSVLEQFEQSPEPMKDVLERLPAAALGLARRRPAATILGAIGILGLVWYFSKRH